MTLQINTTTGQRALTTEEQTDVREGIGAQSGAQVSAAAAAAVTTHTSAADPHPGKYAAPDHTHAGLMTAGQSTKLDALPTAAALANAQAAQDLAIEGKAAADHTHALLMTAAERTKLGDLPTAAALAAAQSVQDTAINGRMLNTADAIADALDVAPPADLARIQSSVSDAVQPASLTPTRIAAAVSAVVGDAPWEAIYNDAPNMGGGAGTRNRAVWMGFNAGRHAAAPVTPGQCAIIMGFEHNYFDTSGVNATNEYGPEWYIEYWSPDGTSQTMLRPFYVRVDGSDSNTASNCTITHDIGSDGRGQFQVYAQGQGPRNLLLSIAQSGTTLKGPVTFGDQYADFAAIGYIRGNLLAAKDLLLQPGSATGRVIFANSDGSANNLILQNNGDLVVRDGAGIVNFGSGVQIQKSGGGKLGFFGATPVVKPTLPGIATDLASAITLVNELRAKLLAFGLSN